MSRAAEPSKRWKRPWWRLVPAPGSAPRPSGGDKPPRTKYSLGRGSLLSRTARRRAVAVSSACSRARAIHRCTVRVDGFSLSAGRRGSCVCRPFSDESQPHSAVATTRLQNHTEARSSGGREWHVSPVSRFSHRCLCTVMRRHEPRTNVHSIRANVPCPTHSGPGRSPRNTRRPSASFG